LLRGRAALWPTFAVFFLAGAIFVRALVAASNQLIVIYPSMSHGIKGAVVSFQVALLFLHAILSVAIVWRSSRTAQMLPAVTARLITIVYLCVITLGLFAAGLLFSILTGFNHG
jgi:hypothetical protein